MLSENIKNLRKQKGLTQEELAVRLNVVRQTKASKTGFACSSRCLYRSSGVSSAKSSSNPNRRVQ